MIKTGNLKTKLAGLLYYPEYLFVILLWKNKHMKKLIRSFQHAADGFLNAVRTETNLRIHLVAAVICCTAGFLLTLTPVEWILVVCCITAVIAFELINTAIEQLCNLVTKEQHPSVKQIKDISAAAVLMVSIGAAVIAAIIFLPKLMNQFIV